MAQPVNLSAVMITKNEEHCIGRCLDSISFADEIVVLDSESIDRTVEIARAKGAQVFSSSIWPGFGPQKNRALELAKGRWILSIDADEVVTGAAVGRVEEALVRRRLGSAHVPDRDPVRGVGEAEVLPRGDLCGDLHR